MKNRIPFYKMHGGGNDFVLIDHRQRFIPEAEQPQFARRVCHRQLGAGADGLILIEASPTANFRWRFYNADGSEPEMCGNGGRCAARFAVINGIAPAEMSFETLAGPSRPKSRAAGSSCSWPGWGIFVRIKCIPLEGNPGRPFPQGGRAPRGGAGGRPGYGDPVTGGAGRSAFIRCLPPRGPTSISSGWKAPKPSRIRTYERGVEDETLACGTGAVASALIAARLGQAVSPVTVHTRGGEALIVSFYA
jgi:diaminopimelate epimerase